MQLIVEIIHYICQLFYNFSFIQTLVITTNLRKALMTLLLLQKDRNFLISQNELLSEKLAN